MRKSILTRTMAFVCAFSVAAPAFPADLKSQMENMFKSSGMMANNTPPNVYQTQSNNIATLGSMQVRTPVQNTQLFNYSLPTLKAGCGGVDLRLGAFSWINEEQFKQMLQAIGNNTVGMLFQIAIKGISSLIGSNIDMLMKQLQDASNFFSNSCKNAEMLLDGFAGNKTADLYSACMKVRRLSGDDENQARWSCMDQAPSINQNASNSNDPAMKNVAQRDVNLIWDALKNTGLTHEEKELYMNISGTVIVRAQKADNSGSDNNQTIDPSITDFKSLETGNADLPLNTQPGDVALGGWWSCDKDADPQCLAPKQLASKVFTPFTQLVTNKLGSLRDAMWANKTVSTDDVNFVNNSTLPIAQMLRIGYMSGRDQLTNSFINRYAGVIGYDFAYNFLNRGMRDARNYLNNGSHRRGIEDRAVNDLRDHMDKMLAHLDAQRQTSAADQATMNSMVTNLVEVEKQMYATLPSGIQNMLSFSNQMGSIRGR